MSLPPTRRQALSRLAALSLSMLTADLTSARASAADAPTPFTLWYDEPAKSAMNEALPIGNGRLGAVVFGGTSAERLAFNVDSLWTGDANPSGDYNTMGAYQAFGDLLIDLPDHQDATDYRRTLGLEDALATVTYRVRGARYSREYFATAPAGVIVARIAADRPGGYRGTIRLRDTHGAIPVADTDGIALGGKLSNGLRYAARIVVTHENGSVTPNADGSLTMAGCDSVTVYLGALTDYAMDPAANFRQAPAFDVVSISAEQVRGASRRGYAALAAAHVRDHRALFDRVTVDFGTTPADRRSLPTDRRKLLAANGDDPELDALLFQYGRYLLIACSRPGSLPANLQGLWNDSNDPPWHCDYHANINIQMNYWPAEPAGLPECHLPLFDLVGSQVMDWRTATGAAPEFKLPNDKPPRGWALRTSHNITGGMGWNWDKTANAWYCRHYYEHWAFNRDERFLRDRVYPTLREICEFWEEHLKALPDGRLVVPLGWSPEHGPVEDGVTYNQEIVWDLFTNFIEASTALGADPAYRAKVAEMREKLVGPKIGHWGQLQEWMTDRDDPADPHRHTSHLFAVYPGRQIGLSSTPTLAAAAAKSLIARGDGGDAREWSFAWRAALWARLGDGERAHGQMRQLFSARNSCTNLFGLHPPMQMDGNFGITAGVAEMVLQSHETTPEGVRVIHLLPALPGAWASGHANGLRARGGFTVDQAWSNGALTSATLHAGLAMTVPVRYRDNVRVVTFKRNATVKLTAGDFT